MNIAKKLTLAPSLQGGAWKDVPGIIIADGGSGRRVQVQGPRLRAFIYGEDEPSSPTLPFGRWKT